MSDAVIFIFGVIAFLFAVGPLMVAAYLEYRDGLSEHEH